MIRSDKRFAQSRSVNFLDMASNVTDQTTTKWPNGDSGNDSLITNRFSQDSATGDDLELLSGVSSYPCGDNAEAAKMEEGDVHSIFLCEFHPTAGPKITLQVPNDDHVKDLFRIVHQYIIPKVPLQGSFLSM